MDPTRCSTHTVLAVCALLVALGCTEDSRNYPPVAVDDTASTLVDVPFFIEVLANDYDANHDELHIVSYTQPASGTVVESANGRFFYTPPAGFEGSVLFEYTIADGHGLTATATVTVTVVNNPPLAVADAVSTHPDTALDIDVLANDSDPDGDEVTMDSFTQPSDGVVVDLGGGTLRYTPPAGFEGSVTFTYTISDSGGKTATATVSVAVVNDPPLAVADAVSTGIDAALDIDVLANDSDPDGDAMTIESFTQPADGAVVDVGGGTLSYTPPGGFIGFTSFTYTINDGYGKTATAAVSVAVGVTAQLAVTEVSGLFRPGAGGIGFYEAGYLSGDDLGRIYTNHEYAPGDPGTTVWAANRQYVDITVDILPAGVNWPADARVVWEYEDVHDRSNEDVLTHAEAGPTLDPNDYDAVDNDLDGTPDNSDGEDNTGSRDGLPAWEEIDPSHALANGNETVIAGGSSSVRFNVTDDGGDNFVVRASLKLTSGGEPVAVAETGAMTVWKRINVEYVVMESATPLDGFANGQANDGYAKACVEMVAHERTVADFLAGGDLQMGVNEYDASQACEAYVTRAGGEFQHEGEGGWFFCAAANHFVDSTGAGPTPYLYAGPSRVCSDGLTLQLPIGATLSDDDKYAEGDKIADRPPAGGYRVMKTDFVFDQADLFADGTLLYDYDAGWDTFDGQAAVISHTQGVAGNGAEITYAADADATNGYVLIYKPFVSSVAMWNPDDPSGLEYVIFRYANFSWDPGWDAFGVWSKDYSTPTEYSCMSFDVIDHGFPADGIADIVVLGIGGLVVSGISPGPNGGLEGRTLVFTASGGDLNTLLHEFGHAFGFHHICGNWDYRSDDTAGHACPMHYDSWYFMLDHSTPRRLDLWTLDYGGPYFCEEHIIAIRRQNLEDVAVLGWSD